MSSQRPIIGFTAELERQAWDDEGREKDRQKALSGASEVDALALGGLEGLSSAGVSATANLQGVTSRFDWYLDRVVHLERSGTLIVNHDVVRATSDLDSDCFMRHLQGCCHLRSPLSVGRATAPSSSPERVSAHIKQIRSTCLADSSDSRRYDACRPPARIAADPDVPAGR